MRTLVLNAGYEPLAVVTFRRALLLVLAEKASIVVEDVAAPVRSTHGQLPRPTVIVLKRYVRRPYRSMNHVSRRGVLRRDHFRCAYCGRAANTIDHVIPRSRGGLNTWENLVAACLPCNGRKADKTLAQLGWKLKFTPREPSYGGHLISGLDRIDETWNEYLQAS
ncbi:HNH endonuclease [Glutamicibacter endophyticus]